LLVETEFIISAGEQPKRLDRFLVHREPNLSRAAIQRLIATGRVRMNGAPARPARLVRPGDSISIDSPPAVPLSRNGKPMALAVLYEDEACLVVDKPAGVVVHPGPGHWSDTLMNALLDYWAGKSGAGRPGIIHRLDKETSGALLVSKTAEAHRRLANQIECRTVERMYHAFVQGLPAQPEGRIDLPLGQDRTDLRRTSSDADHVKPAITDYHVIEAFGTRAAHLLLRPHTGRTHQIRAHLQALGHPILGDRVYGDGTAKVGEAAVAERVMLHAASIRFTHPINGEPCTVVAPLPDDFEILRQALRSSNEGR